MVCIYCSDETKVTNSRLQKRHNTVWRRRQCLACKATFTSLEKAAYEHTLVVQNNESHIVAFQRDILFLSIYDACRHRPNAAIDAAALTDTILSQLLTAQPNPGTILRSDIVKIVSDVLQRFDQVAHVHYTAFHSYKTEAP